MNLFRFGNWKIYIEAKELFKLITEIVRKLPSTYKYSIGDQVIRSSLSVILNIAEGSGKSSDRELNRFLNISIGSLNETLAVADVMKDIKLIKQDEFDNIYKYCESISRQMGGFKKVISYKL